MLYRVIWEIDIEADTPTGAAEQARTIQKRSTCANVFTVMPGRGVEIDLDDLDV